MGEKATVETGSDGTINRLASGIALLQAGRAEEAAEVLGEGLKKSPNSVEIRYYLACALLESDRFKDALGHFWSIAGDDPKLDNPLSVAGLSALAGMGKCHAALGQWAEAYSVMMPAMGIALSILRNLALILEEAGDHSRAAYLFSICVMLAPEDVELVVSAGYNKRESGLLEEALVDLKQAVRLEPKDADLWYELGLTYSMMDNVREARPIFKKALRLDPAHRWAWYDLACLDAREQNAAGAFRQLNKSLDCGFRDLHHLLNDDDFRHLREDPRWKQVVRRIKNSQQSRERKRADIREPGRSTVH